MASQTDLAVSDTPIYDIYCSARKAALLTVAVHLGLFDKLNERSLTTTQVISDFGLTERGADALLVGLRSLGLLEGSVIQTQNGEETQYELTSLSQLYLVKGKHCYLGGLIQLEWDNFMTPQDLLKAMKTGRSQVYNTEAPMWEEHEKDMVKAQTFTKAMHSISERPATFVSKLFEEFPEHKCLLDVGAGSGVYSLTAVCQHPQLSAIIFDLPPACAVAQDFVSKANLENRCAVVKGDMFKDAYPTFFPGKNDLQVDMIFYSQIFHDWTRSQGVELIKKTHQYLPKNGLIFIHEKLLTDERDGPSANAMVNLDMLFWTDGHQYSAKELFKMLVENGFKDPKVKATVGYWSIVWATKA